MKFPAFYGTRKFTKVSTRARSLSWTIRIQSTSSNPVTPIFILILSSHIREGLLRSVFPWGFQTKILYVFISPIRATWSAHLNFLDLIILIPFGEADNLRSSTLRRKVAATLTAGKKAFRMGRNSKSPCQSNSTRMGPMHTLNVLIWFHIILAAVLLQSHLITHLVPSFLSSRKVRKLWTVFIWLERASNGELLWKQ